MKDVQILAKNTTGEPFPSKEHCAMAALHLVGAIQRRNSYSNRHILDEFSKLNSEAWRYQVFWNENTGFGSKAKVKTPISKD